MTDEQIIALFWARNELAIQETDSKYGRYFHYVAFGILDSDEDAKEIVNDTYWKAWDVIPPQKPNYLKAFLGRITRQLSINRLEHNTAQKRGCSQYPIALEELTACIPTNDPGTDVEDILALRDCLNDFLHSLPLQVRRVFIRRYWHLHSVAQIAKEFAFSESKVKSMLMRTREKLKEHLICEGFVYEK